MTLIRGALEQQLHSTARSMGADYFGIADIRFVHAIWPDSFAECGLLPTGISIGVREDDTLIDGLPQTDDACRTSHYNDKIALALTIADALTDELARAGHLAHRLSHPPKLKPTGLYKLVARYAGIGWIGKNRLLITPDHGPRVALATVLTDAPLLPTTEQPLWNQCGACTKCLDACPVRAYADASFGDLDSLDGFSTRLCSIYRGVINPTGWGVCGLCVKACPFGQVKE